MRSGSGKKIFASRKTLDIGEVVKISGVPPSTLRYYEEKGLIRSIWRHGLRRQYDYFVIHQLEFISMGRHAGLTLDEILTMFSPEGRLQVNRQFLIEKAHEIARNIRKLSAIQNTLRHIAKCSAPNHMVCPKFQRLLHVAGKKPLRGLK